MKGKVLAIVLLAFLFSTCKKQVEDCVKNNYGKFTVNFKAVGGSGLYTFKVDDKLFLLCGGGGNTMECSYSENRMEAGTHSWHLERNSGLAIYADNGTFVVVACDSTVLDL